MNIHKFDDVTLYTSQNCVPYDNDWTAIDDNYQASQDEFGSWQHDGIVGEGNTEQDAIENYFDKLQEWREYNPSAIGAYRE